MAQTTAGDFTEITYSHPTLGSGSFFPKANEGNTLDEGGLRNNDDANQIDGGGNLIVQKNRVRGSFEIVCANDMNTRNDVSKAKALAASPVSADWTISHTNGTVWAGNGTIVGDIQTDTNAGTFTLKVASAEFKKIVG